MVRREERAFRLNDEIAALRHDEELAAEELITLQHLDDAQRDAAVSEHPIDRADARETSADARRMEGRVANLGSARENLERKRDRVVRRLGGE